jgi:6-phosphogluconate dehydrogenase (decarboxylating)
MGRRLGKVLAQRIIAELESHAEPKLGHAHGKEDFQGKVLSAMRFQFGGHREKSATQ